MKRDGYATLGTVVLAGFGVWFAFLLDFRGINTGGFLVYLAFFSLNVLPAVLYVRSRLKIAIFAVAVVAIIGAHVVPWNSRKVFLADLYSIQPGMSRAEVDAIMERYIKGSGWPANPTARSGEPSTLHDAGSGRAYPVAPSNGRELVLEDTVIYRHSRSPEYDSDWGIVAFRNGKVSRVEFSAD